MSNRLLLLVPFAVLLCAAAHAQHCYASADKAAQSVIGTVLQNDGGGSTTGFRAQDVQVDPMLHRAWVRVRRCDAANAPLLLIPLRVNMAGEERFGQQPVVSASAVQLQAPTMGEEFHANSPIESEPRILALHAGEPVTVTFVSSAVHMEVAGTADGSAAIGETVGVVLQRRGDEPVHRMRGTLRAGHQVEVQR